MLQSPRLRRFLLASVACVSGCYPAVHIGEAEPDRILVGAAVDASGQVGSLLLSDGGGLAFSAETPRTVVFEVEWAGGLEIEVRERTRRGRGCDRCIAPSFGRHLNLETGDACPIPLLSPAWIDGARVSADDLPDWAKGARRQLVIENPSTECSRPQSSDHRDTADPLVIDHAGALLEDLEAEPPRLIGTSSTGYVLALGAHKTALFRSDGTRVPVEPYPQKGLPLSLGPTRGGFVALFQRPEKELWFIGFDGKVRPLRLVPTNLQDPTTVRASQGHRVLIAGRKEGLLAASSYIANCKVEEDLDCTALSFGGVVPSIEYLDELFALDDLRAIGVSREGQVFPVGAQGTTPSAAVRIVDGVPNLGLTHMFLDAARRRLVACGDARPSPGANRMAYLLTVETDGFFGPATPQITVAELGGGQCAGFEEHDRPWVRKEDGVGFRIEDDGTVLRVSRRLDVPERFLAVYPQGENGVTVTYWPGAVYRVPPEPSPAVRLFGSTSLPRPTGITALSDGRFLSFWLDAGQTSARTVSPDGTQVHEIPLDLGGAVILAAEEDPASGRVLVVGRSNQTGVAAWLDLDDESLETVDLPANTPRLVDLDFMGPSAVVVADQWNILQVDGVTATQVPIEPDDETGAILNFSDAADCFSIERDLGGADSKDTRTLRSVRTQLHHGFAVGCGASMVALSRDSDRIYARWVPVPTDVAHIDHQITLARALGLLGVELGANGDAVALSYERRRKNHDRPLLISIEPWQDGRRTIGEREPTPVPAGERLGDAVATPVAILGGTLTPTLVHSFQNDFGIVDRSGGANRPEVLGIRPWAAAENEAGTLAVLGWPARLYLFRPVD